MRGIDERPDHGGGVDAAAAQWGGLRSDWIDLSTGINPQPYPIPLLSPNCWVTLPDTAAEAELIAAARAFWRVPDAAAVLAAPGCSAVIARLPDLAPAARVRIAQPTYNEYGRAFAAAGWALVDGPAEAAVIVHPNNPDGRLFDAPDTALSVIDESFCDVTPEASLIDMSARSGTLVLKSFGKFWGLAGLRLGFVIGDPNLISRLGEMLGPWPVSGPALAIGKAALSDMRWADQMRSSLEESARRLDRVMAGAGAVPVGGTTLFRLYETDNARSWQGRLARHRIWTRIFPYSDQWLRLGIPGDEEQWARLERAVSE